MRLAFFTPLNADRRGPWASAFSGLSDHNEELLASLAGLADVDVVVDGYQPANAWIRDRFRVLNPEEFLRCHGQYTAAIYHVANSFPQHSFMVPSMRKVPGIMVLHDCCLQHLALGLTLRRGDFRGLRRILQETYGSEPHGGNATLLAAKLMLGMGDPGSMLFARPFVEMSRGVIVYNEFARQCVLRLSPQKMVRVIPLGVPAAADTPNAGILRQRYGFEPGHFIVASTNSLSHTKRLNLSMEAVAALRDRFPRLRLLIVGGGSIGADADRLIRKFQLDNAVKSTGWVSSEDYRGLLNMSDVVVDLRYPSGAETAGSLARAFAAGKPAIVSAQGSFLDLPGEACFKIPVGEGEGPELQRALTALIEDTPTRERMGAAAREFARTNLTLEGAARQCVEFVREVCTADASASDGYFGEPAASAAERLLVAGAYKLGRAGYFYKHYGMAQTLRRLREETGKK